MSTTASENPVSWLHGIPGTTVAMLRDLPKGAHRLLMSDPTQNESQRELFRDACFLHRAGVPEAAALEFLRSKFSGYYRDIQDREFERAVENARHAAEDERERPKYPPLNTGLLVDVLAETEGSLESLKAASPVKDPGLLSSGGVIDLVFPDAKLLCFAARKESSITKPRVFFVGDEERNQFMVPNVMDSELGMTQERRMSARSNQNVGPQVFQVIEFDRGTLEEQAKLHLHLKTMAPLVMVVFSGGKSLHGWYRIDKLGGDRFSRFLHYASALGADRATYVPCQLVRTPNAVREPDGAKQEVLYLNPEAGK